MLSVRPIRAVRSQDRLYIRAEGSASRRACQTVLAAVLARMQAALAPILPHMAEDVFQATPYGYPPAESVFQAGWPATPSDWRSMPQARPGFGFF